MKLCLVCEGATQAEAARCSTCGAWLVPGSDLHYPTRRGEGETGNAFVGAVIDGKYRLQAVLGRGGLGTVFQAQHTGSLLPVAIKLLHPRFAEQREHRSNLRDEARRAASVLHDRCARLLDVGEAEDGVTYLAMELVQGETLEAVAQAGPLAPGHVAAILHQVAEALVAIHAAGLVHCDLSPRNVMVAGDADGLRVKVLDFGIARTVSLRGGERTARSDAGGFFNPVFSAPELLRSGDVDVRADFYSLGMLGLLLLRGELPPAAGAPAAQLPRGLPRRLHRLLARCLAEAPADRPAAASPVERELAALLRARQPLLRRTAWLAAGLVAVGNLVGGTRPEPFLRARTGAALALAAPGSELLVQHCRTLQLHTVGLHFGGFPAEDLRLELSRGGQALLRQPLAAEVEAGGDALVLSIAQPSWLAALGAIGNASRDGDVDLTFVAAGRGALAVARLRLDDQRPSVAWQLEPAEALHAATRLQWRAEDDTAVARLAAQVRLPDGALWRVPLAGAQGELALGAVLAERQPGVAPFGPVEVAVEVHDAAGNAAPAAWREVALADLAAPALLEVGGPAGEPYAPVVDGAARLLVRRAESEPGCRLELRREDGELLLATAWPGDAPSLELQVPSSSPSGPLRAGRHVLALLDAAGNRSELAFALQLRDLDLQLRLVAVGPAPATHATELVLGSEGAELRVEAAAAQRLLAAAFAADFGPPAPPLVVRRTTDGATLLTIPPLDAGLRRLALTFEDSGAHTPTPVRFEVPTRVLPPAIEVRVPEPTSRFLPGQLATGVLRGGPAGLVDGPGWRVDGDLAGYLRGVLWVGSDTLAPLALPVRRGVGEPLLPELPPVPGRNRLAAAFVDVLGRPARVLVGARPGLEVAVDGGTAVVVADFWWHDAPPVPIGEAVLVEHGQAAQVRLQLPIGYTPAELPLLRLGVGSAELPASAVAARSDGTVVVRFDVPVSVWSAAAAWGDLPREVFAEGRERRLDAYLATPLGRQDMTVQLRTTRSTLQPLLLGDLATLPPALAALSLLPVLAPAVPFAEPVPLDAPPRALFRPQPAVPVRNCLDFLLQDREFTNGQARALLAASAGLPADVSPEVLVHADDPLGSRRLSPTALLPAPGGDDDAPLVGVDFHQAYAACRVLAVLVAGEPDALRLPFGCELELAAYAAARRPAAYAALAAGDGVARPAFEAAAERLAAGEPSAGPRSLAAGDQVPSGFDAPLLGLDFGVREWVFDLPHVPGAELLLREWWSDHGKHLERATAFARGEAPPADLAAAVRALGVVRGLALGERDGLLDATGARLPASGGSVVLPASVPGVLRSEQVRRDGRDLLARRADPRLSRTGFRVVGTGLLVQRWRGRS